MAGGRDRDQTREHEMMEEFYTTITPALITRFKEREENIKADIFHNYQALLKQASPQVR